MIVLGIETSTAVCSVGISSDGGMRIHRSVLEAHIHSEKLQTLIRDAATEAAIDLHSLDAVAVSIGPGSFTGLRVGLSTAKGLCYAIEKPLITLPTFRVIAESAFGKLSHVNKILVALDAKKGDYYGGSYARGVPEAEIRKVHLARIEELRVDAEALDPDLIITDRPDLLQLELRNVPCTHIHEFCRGDVVADLGRQRAEAGEHADLASVEPIYLKNFMIQGDSVAS